jgi:uncharacterized RDD family membrane protein YckC
VPYCPSCGGFHAEDAGYCPFCGSPVGDTPPAVRYSGFWRRVGGAIIDSLVIGIPWNIFEALIGGSGLSSNNTVNAQGHTVTHFHVDGGRFFPLLIAQFAVACIYSVLMQTSKSQGTLGMMAVGVMVTDVNGERISRGRAVGRYLAYLLASVILGLGLLLMLVTKRKQGLHDLIAGTLVVRARE